MESGKLCRSFHLTKRARITGSISRVFGPQLQIGEDWYRAALRYMKERDELLAALKIAFGQLEGVKPKGGVHASSLRADLEIVSAAISNAERGQQ